MVSRLLRLGADVNARSEVYLESEEASRLLSPGLSAEASCRPGKTPLILAASRGNTAIVQLLLDHGADYEAHAVQIGTVLNAAACAGHDDIVRRLLERGAAIESTSRWGATPILGASIPSIVPWGKDEIVRLANTVRLLADHGANLEARSFFDRTPLARAAEYSSCEAAARVLLEKGADIEARDEQGDTPLGIAAYEGNDSLARLFIYKGPILKARMMKATLLFTQHLIGLPVRT
ncbi:ankyrin repeat-containing domain protein [Aspergillus insuetus]